MPPPTQALGDSEEGESHDFDQLAKLERTKSCVNAVKKRQVGMKRGNDAQSEFQEELNRLEVEKEAHIREVRRLRDEQSSQYCERQLLKNRYQIVELLFRTRDRERKRELATIKLLGFYDIELAVYVYRENVLLTLIGILAGILMGNVLHRFVIETVEVDMIMFGRSIHFISYLYGIGLTLLFAVFVNVTMFYKLRRIDMVESLKSAE